MAQHKTPCKECPWRRKSLPGWLGNSTPGEFWWSAEREDRMECHLAVDYDQGDLHAQVMAAPQCAGAAVFFANQMRIRRHPDHLRLPADKENVFCSAQEFIDHHSRKVIT